MDRESLIQQFSQLLEDFKPMISGEQNQVLVVGCSTSEIVGKQIGTEGSYELAEIVFREINTFAEKCQLHLAFQCCEHLNRSLVVERELINIKQLQEVSVIPNEQAGGVMATYAYQHLEDACVVESIQADYGIDIGQTLIGMHLKPVVVPVRVSQNQVGKAHVTLAITRPKLIGGERATYRFQTK